MSTITIWHNQNCSKSRVALEFLQDKNLELKIKNYLNEILSVEELKEVLSFLGFESVKELIRTSELLYSSLKLDLITDEELLIKEVIKNPSLIQRPIIIKDKKAVIARPLENVNNIL